VYNPYSRPLSSLELQALLPGCDGYIAGLDAIDAAALEAADKLRVIARYGVGVDNVDLEAAARMGITVANTPLANAVSVAELTIGLMLSLARSLPALAQQTKAGGWPRMVGVTLQGKTVGLLGLGAIGKEVARRLRCFRCTVLAHDPKVDEAFAGEHGVALVPVDELLARCDFVSLHLPVLADTRGMVNAAFLSWMKPGSYLINTSRGELVDEHALLEALQTGHVAGAALDAFAQEPPGAENPLLAHPNVIATPHTGAHTDGATNAMGRGALDACLAVLKGEAPAHRVV
jgi:D-3-phosphoglycerate dehydrogenase